MVITYGVEPDPAKRLREKQGARLKTARTMRKWSLTRLAREMERNGTPVTQQAISAWERGISTPRPHMRVAVCQALNIAPSMVWNLDEEIAA